MRGKPQIISTLFLHVGLIPAHAGKTRLESSPLRNGKAHPRACGENRDNAERATYVKGSSPRMRGKLGRTSSQHAFHRLIPAHAGKTGRSDGTLRTYRAHPRACGENATTAASTGVGRGSSPRMRGKPPTSSACISTTGLIPAHAGKTRLLPVSG